VYVTQGSDDLFGSIDWDLRPVNVLVVFAQASLGMLHGDYYDYYYALSSAAGQDVARKLVNLVWTHELTQS
jgi:hypothetical protein